jgi:hypothetical protein
MTYTCSMLGEMHMGMNEQHRYNAHGINAPARPSWLRGLLQGRGLMLHVGVH